ncbi:hypothetical protein BX666DRAFT_1934489 [Dichotomocladium elegans]|nr:hypothetical protein BX666DRAFT_1934489 [Dichotomocladium elegans]
MYPGVIYLFIYFLFLLHAHAIDHRTRGLWILKAISCVCALSVRKNHFFMHSKDFRIGLLSRTEGINSPWILPS